MTRHGGSREEGDAERNSALPQARGVQSNLPTRKRKLTNFLQAQIINPAFADMPKAIIEWNEDLDWVEQNYGHPTPRRVVLEVEP
jgi:hypothetical protein